MISCYIISYYHIILLNAAGRAGEIVAHEPMESQDGEAVMTDALWRAYYYYSTIIITITITITTIHIITITMTITNHYCYYYYY